MSAIEARYVLTVAIYSFNKLIRYYYSKYLIIYSWLSIVDYLLYLIQVKAQREISSCAVHLLYDNSFKSLK